MSLLQDLTHLGDQLIAGEIPAGHEVPKVLAAIVHYIETGGLTPPERAPSTAVQQQINEEQAEIARLRSEVAALQAAQAQAPAQSPTVTTSFPVPPPTSPAPPAGGQEAGAGAPQPPAELA